MEGGIGVKVLIDADACPVTTVAAAICRELGIECHLICDTAHMLSREGCVTHVVDKGADSADLAIANRTQPGDLVITQDYGLASLCLARRAVVLHQDGWAYTEDNIQALLFQRHETRKYRASGGRVKGPTKRRPEQDKAFAAALRKLLQQSVQG